MSVIDAMTTHTITPVPNLPKLHSSCSVKSVRLRIAVILMIVLVVSVSRVHAQNLYFPPLNNSLTWDSIPVASMGWCTNRIDSLYRFLEQQRSKAFIVLKDGKIVLEKYFGTFTQDSVWYWASAGKTLTAFLVGKAKEEGFLSLDDSSSRFLGVGWTNCTTQQEAAIKIRHHLSMTSGLDDGVPDNHCTLDSCLIYKAAPGTRWAYHNAPYTLLEKVIEQATGQNINVYTTLKLKNKTGMTGLWAMSDYDNVFYSKARSMARFGLLMQNRVKWGTEALLTDTVYTRQLVNTSQPINRSYGYLWWLNGKSSFMIPQSQLVFPGWVAPSAPYDMYAAIGKNGQIISIAPTLGLVVVRMGEAPYDGGEVALTLCEDIWKNLNYVMCSTSTYQTYTFTGTGTWSTAANWQDHRIPPAQLNPGDQIIINPVLGGECIADVNQTLPTGTTIRVMAGKRMRVTGNLIIQ